MSNDKRRGFPFFTILFVLIVAAAVVDLFVLRDTGEPEVAATTTSKPTAATDDERAPAPAKRPASILPALDVADVDDPTRDGWTTEALTAQASRQLKKLGALLAGSNEIAPDALAPLLAEGFRCTPLVPPKLTTVFRDDVIEVQRGGSAEAGDMHQGADGFGAAIRDFTSSLRGATDMRVKFKTYRVAIVDDKTFTTRQYVALSGRTADGVIEQNATWDIDWKCRKGSAGILAVRVIEYERAHTRRGDAPLFADCTEAVLSDDSSYEAQILLGYHQIGPRYQDVRYFAQLSNPGIAIGDVNGDGLQDLYFCGEFGLPNRLYVQQADGTVRDTAKEAGVDWLENSRSALLVDLDNDGDQDLAVAIVGGVVVCANDGRGRFERKAVVPTGDDTMSLSAVDYDRDGRLDLYVCVYYKTGVAVRSIPAVDDQFVVHDANTGGPNSLLRNAGNWTFTDVTKTVGLDAKNRRFSFAAAWDDVDNDGDLDCYVANDYGRDNLYRNDGATFTDISHSGGAEDSAGGMSITWGDYDRDGWMDVFVSNMFSSAGNRITYQDAFEPRKGGGDHAKRRLQRLARGNTLLRNGRDAHCFDHVSATAGVEMGRWAWGSHFVDLNNDGWEDLVIGNGYVTGDDGTGDL